MSAELLYTVYHPAGADEVAYQRLYPRNDVLLNGCIFDDGTEIWFGDIDFDRDRVALEKLAREVGTIHITPETPYRWWGLEPPPEQLPRGRRGIRTIAGD